MKDSISILSGTEIIQKLGKRYAEYRKRAKMTQKEVSEQSGLSIFTISGFENGSQTGISMGAFIKLMRAIGEIEQIDELLPELPQSPKEKYLELMKALKKTKSPKKI